MLALAQKQMGFLKIIHNFNWFTVSSFGVLRLLFSAQQVGGKPEFLAHRKV